MDWRKETWTVVLVTIVTVLIWFWAAGETRDQQRLNARIRFNVPDPENWAITPDQIVIGLLIEGSKLSLQNAESLLRRPLNVTVPAAAGRQTVDLAERVRLHEELRATGVTVLSVDLAATEIDIDGMQQSKMRVRPVLPGVTTEGEVTVDPAEVTVTMPSDVRQRLTQNLLVEAPLEKFEIERLEPGVRQTRDVKVRLPEDVGPIEHASISPAKVRVSFTIRSKQRDVTLDSVRVQVVSSPEDLASNTVEIDPKLLRNVTVSADFDLARQIENGEASVVAMVPLSARDIDVRVESKPIAYFVAMIPESNGSMRGEIVRARIGNSDAPPVVRLTIAPRIQ